MSSTLSEHEQAVDFYLDATPQARWMIFVPKADNDKMQCNIMELQPRLQKVISELFG